MMRSQMKGTVIDRTTDETTGETTSHPTKQPKDGCQVVGYDGTPMWLRYL